MVPSRQSIEQKLSEVLSKIKMDRQLIDRKRLTSLQLVDLLVAIENEFQFEIEPTEYDPQVFSSYDNLLVFILKMIEVRDN